MNATTESLAEQIERIEAELLEHVAVTTCYTRAAIELETVEGKSELVEAVWAKQRLAMARRDGCRVELRELRTRAR